MRLSWNWIGINKCSLLRCCNGKTKCQHFQVMHRQRFFVPFCYSVDLDSCRILRQVIAETDGFTMLVRKDYGLNSVKLWTSKKDFLLRFRILLLFLFTILLLLNSLLYGCTAFVHCIHNSLPFQFRSFSSSFYILSDAQLFWNNLLRKSKTELFRIESLSLKILRFFVELFGSVRCSVMLWHKMTIKKQFSFTGCKI